MGVETSCDRIVRAYTINNARITFEEELKGSIEPGKLADLVILSADYLTVPESEIQRLTALATMIGGKLVYIDPAARAELARCASATILIYDSSTDQYIYAWRTDKRVTTDHRCRRRERMPMQDSARPSTAPAVTIGRSACGSRNFSGRGSRRLGRQRQGFLDADHVARHVDGRVVASDVTEHHPQGQHLAVDEPMGGFEADAVLTNVDGRPGSVRGFDRKLHVVPRRPAAFRADVRGWRYPARTRTKPVHLSGRTLRALSKKSTKGRRRGHSRLDKDSDRLSGDHYRLQHLGYRGAAAGLS